MPAWSVKTRRVPSRHRTVGMRGFTVIRPRPCMTSTTPPSSPPPSLPSTHNKQRLNTHQAGSHRVLYSVEIVPVPRKRCKVILIHGELRVRLAEHVHHQLRGHHTTIPALPHRGVSLRLRCRLSGILRRRLRGCRFCCCCWWWWCGCVWVILDTNHSRAPALVVFDGLSLQIRDERCRMQTNKKGKRSFRYPKKCSSLDNMRGASAPQIM